MTPSAKPTPFVHLTIVADSFIHHPHGIPATSQTTQDIINEILSLYEARDYAGIVSLQGKAITYIGFSAASGEFAPSSPQRVVLAFAITQAALQTGDFSLAADLLLHCSTFIALDDYATRVQVLHECGKAQIMAYENNSAIATYEDMIFLLEHYPNIGFTWGDSMTMRSMAYAHLARAELNMTLIDRARNHMDTAIQVLNRVIYQNSVLAPTPRPSLGKRISVPLPLDFLACPPDMQEVIAKLTTYSLWYEHNLIQWDFRNHWGVYTLGELKQCYALLLEAAKQQKNPLIAVLAAEFAISVCMELYPDRSYPRDSLYEWYKRVTRALRLAQILQDTQAPDGQQDSDIHYLLPLMAGWQQLWRLILRVAVASPVAAQAVFKQLRATQTRLQAMQADLTNREVFPHIRGRYHFFFGFVALNLGNIDLAQDAFEDALALFEKEAQTETQLLWAAEVQRWIERDYLTLDAESNE